MISMKALFRREGIGGGVAEVISFRNALMNHVEGVQLGLRAAHERFLRLADGNGWSRG
jgi:hypothetical protein